VLTHYILQIKHNEPAYRKVEPIKCKQPKKSIALRQVDNAPYKVEQKFYMIKNFNDFKNDLKWLNGNMQQLKVRGVDKNFMHSAQQKSNFNYSRMGTWSPSKYSTPE
jgi:hypothetical protein